MLTSFGFRTLSVHAPCSRPVVCRAPVALRRSSYANPSKQGLQARSVLLVLRAASEEAAVTEPTADTADTTTPTATTTATDISNTDNATASDSKEGRSKQQQRRPRNDSTNRSKDSRMQANTLYVQNLAWATLSEDLQDTFRSCQGFEDAFIMMNKNDRPAGYGFVRFSSEAAAAAAEEAMNGIELDGRSIKVRFARSGRTDASNDRSRDNAESASGSSASSGDGKFEAATDTETRVVVSNLPDGFTYREVFGMCSLFGGVTKVVMYSKNSGKAVPGLEDDKEADEQVEQDAAAVGDAAAAEDEEEQAGSSSSSAQQQKMRRQGGASVALMVDRGAAERVVGELDGRVVQGTKVRANLYRRKASKKAAAAA